MSIWFSLFIILGGVAFSPSSVFATEFQGVYHDLSPESFRPCGQQYILKSVPDGSASNNFDEFNRTFAQKLNARFAGGSNLNRQEEKCLLITIANVIHFARHLMFEGDQDNYNAYFENLASLFQEARAIDLENNRRCFYYEEDPSIQMGECQSDGYAKIFYVTTQVAWLGFFGEEYHKKQFQKKIIKSSGYLVGTLGVLVGATRLKSLKEFSKAAKAAAKRGAKRLFRVLRRRPYLGFGGVSSGTALVKNKSENLVPIDIDKFKAPVEFIDFREDLQSAYEFGYRKSTFSELANIWAHVGTVFGLVYGTDALITAAAKKWAPQITKTRQYLVSLLQKLPGVAAKPAAAASAGKLIRMTTRTTIASALFYFIGGAVFDFIEKFKRDHEIKEAEKIIKSLEGELRARANSGRLDEIETYMIAQEYTSYVYNLALIYLAPSLVPLSQLLEKVNQRAICLPLGVAYSPRFGPEHIEPSYADLMSQVGDVVDKAYEASLMDQSESVTSSGAGTIVISNYNQKAEFLIRSALGFINEEVNHRIYDDLKYTLYELSDFMRFYLDKSEFLTHLRSTSRVNLDNMNDLVQPIAAFKDHYSQSSLPERLEVPIDSWENYLHTLDDFKKMDGQFYGQNFSQQCPAGARSGVFAQLQRELEFVPCQVNHHKVAPGHCVER